MSPEPRTSVGALAYLKPTVASFTRGDVKAIAAALPERGRDEDVNAIAKAVAVAAKADAPKRAK